MHSISQNLGKCLSEQRLFQKKGTLERSRQERLEELGVIWNLVEMRDDRSWTNKNTTCWKSSRNKVTVEFRQDMLRTGRTSVNGCINKNKRKNRASSIQRGIRNLMSWALCGLNYKGFFTSRLLYLIVLLLTSGIVGHASEACRG